MVPIEIDVTYSPDLVGTVLFIMVCMVFFALVRADP